MDNNLQALIADMDSRFTSGNSVPVRVTHLHATKWAEIRAALEAATALQSSGGEVVAGKWRQLTTSDEVQAAWAAGQEVEWTSDGTDSIDMPESGERDSGGWVPHHLRHGTEDRLFKIGKFRAFAPVTASPAQPSGFVLVPVEPTPEMLRPFASLALAAQGIDPDEPMPPHGEYPRWYEACGPISAAWTTMLTAAPAPIGQEG